MNEQTRSTVKKASKAAIILGGVGVGADQTAAGGILGSAGVIGHTMVNDRDYRSEAKFKCQ